MQASRFLLSQGYLQQNGNERLSLLGRTRLKTTPEPNERHLFLAPE